MNPFEMVVIIVAIVSIAGIMKAKYGRRSVWEDTNETDVADPDAKRLREEVRTLKERIAVLERIATDRTSSLDHEIERLRDK